MCVYFNKWLNCKHSIALAIVLNLKLKGFELKTNLPQRGRTAKARPDFVKETCDLVAKPPVAPRAYRTKN